MRKQFGKIATMLTMLCVAVFAQEKGSFKDARDGKTYKTVKIGTQTWMAENLNYEAKGSKCYDKKSANCAKYGRLYDWNTAMKVCPAGWHLPSKYEWQILEDFVGGNEVAGKKLKAKSGWNKYNPCDYGECDGKETMISGNGEDEYGFAVLPSGAGCVDLPFTGQYGIDDKSMGVGDRGDMWTAWDNDAYYSFGRFSTGHGHDIVCTVLTESPFPFMRGVRCVQGNVEEARAEVEKKAKAEKAKLFNPNIKYGSMVDARDKITYKTVKIGNQTWMAENLNYNAKGSECNGNNPLNCIKYGRLYNWKTALKVCPKGWHLPSNAEWQKLVDFVGGNEVAGKKLKAESGWNNDNATSGNGTDDYGFAALPGGNNSEYFSNSSYVGNSGFWWSTSKNNIPNMNIEDIKSIKFYNSYEYTNFEECYEESLSYSVRCLQN